MSPELDRFHPNFHTKQPFVPLCFETYVWRFRPSRSAVMFKFSKSFDTHESNSKSFVKISDKFMRCENQCWSACWCVHSHSGETDVILPIQSQQTAQWSCCLYRRGTGMCSKTSSGILGPGQRSSYLMTILVSYLTRAGQRSRHQCQCGRSPIVCETILYFWVSDKCDIVSLRNTTRRHRTVTEVSKFGRGHRSTDHANSPRFPRIKPAIPARLYPSS